jgi:hypothetical protein
LACGGAAAAAVGGVHGSPHGAWSSRVMAACSVGVVASIQDELVAVEVRAFVC